MYLVLYKLKVEHGSTVAELPLLVTRMNGASLIGRNWLNRLQLSVNSINQLHNKPLEQVLNKHLDIFGDNLGCLRGFKAKICADPNIPLQFHKPRPIPYSMTSLIDEALDKLVQQEVIEPIMFSDWACPFVPVLKKDKKSIRICGDFSVTVNREIQLQCSTRRE